MENGKGQDTMIAVVYTPSYQVILTRRCAFSCSYCNFPNTPSPMPPSPKIFRSYLRTAQRLGAWQITLTSGEGVDHLQEIASAMRYYGFRDWYEYLEELCRLTLTAKGKQPLTPVLDVGAIPMRAVKRLAQYTPLVRLMLDSVDPDLATVVHAQAPQKSPILRTLAMKDLGKAGIPLITGIRIGIGESHASWLRAIDIANEVHKEYGNVAAFHLVPFVPQNHSPMANEPPVSNDLFKSAISTVRDHLNSQITLVAEVHHRLALAPEAVVSGAFDLGPIRIANNERFDVDMLNAVNAVSDLLSRINVSMESVPVLREAYLKEHRLSDMIEQNISRFQTLNQFGNTERDTPAEGVPVPAIS